MSSAARALAALGKKACRGGIDVACCRTRHVSSQPQQQSRAATKTTVFPQYPLSGKDYEALLEKIADQYSSGKNTLLQYVSTLRTKAAMTLTSSLSEEDRRYVLNAIDAIDVNQAKEENNRSVGEAVALAESKWKKEEAILRQAEEASMARVANEIKIQQQRLEEERHKLLQKERELTQRTVDHHPILGPAIADLGYKRIHLVNGSILSTIPVWEKQRTYRHDRAKLMAQDKLKTKQIGLPGIITLHETRDGRLSIIDGQHRVGMILVLLERNPLDDFFKNVLVEVFPENHVSHAQDIFTEINKAEPVKLVDLPGVAKVAERKIINEAAAALAAKYPAMFKPSQRCRPPHLNTDNLRDALFTANILNKHDHIKSQADLLLWLEDHNAELGRKYKSGVSTRSANDVAVSKSIENEFYLGLESTWLY
eukprot:CAMPEP_0172417084 /NCGR_PEP_ID=MMETSP1064-20121228/3592_1 /TAXON_ID=202472 /ORGANISM="Aulacoseira subarctica , Strain CCAP 1002/5" /LENGTH=424 /DNA_ID=CAMNT_0013155175 /DNA_START=8 /DNA_END=1282 /DNA_ORIENTATION=-